VVAVAITTAAALAAPSGAQAQCVEGAECTFVRPDGKGIIGLGLIGAELGLIIPALAGVRDEWWPYLVFPLIGAVAGGIGGWAIEDATGPRPPTSRGEPEVSVTLLAVGMVLIVPTIVGTLALTAYSPPEQAAESDEDYEPEDITDDDSVEATHDDSAAPAEGTSDESGATSRNDSSRRDSSRVDRHATGMAARMQHMLAGGPGFIRLRLGEAGGPQVFLAAPLPYSASSYTAEERAHLLLNASSDFFVPMFSATF